MKRFRTLNSYQIFKNKKFKTYSINIKGFPMIPPTLMQIKSGRTLPLRSLFIINLLKKFWARFSNFTSLLLKVGRYYETWPLSIPLIPRPQPAILQGYFWVMRPRNRPPGSSCPSECALRWWVTVTSQDFDLDPPPYKTAKLALNRGICFLKNGPKRVRFFYAST